jgi:hypothetical protein
MTDRINQERKRFEAWAESIPHQRNTARHGSNDEWPGQYRDYSLQLAWESWLEALRMSETRDG